MSLIMLSPDFAAQDFMAYRGGVLRGTEYSRWNISWQSIFMRGLPRNSVKLVPDSCAF